MKKNTTGRYIALDCSGWPLRFTGSGRSVQCSAAEADIFTSRAEAEAALARAGEERDSLVTCVD